MHILQRSFQDHIYSENIGLNLLCESAKLIDNEYFFNKLKNYNTLCYSVFLSRSCSTDRDIFPLCQHAVSEVGKPGYPGGLITRRAVSTFAKLRVDVSSNQPLATTFFQRGLFAFSMPYLCSGFVKCLCAFGVGMYNPVLTVRSCDTRIFLVLRSLCLHLSH